MFTTEQSTTGRSTTGRSATGRSITGRSITGRTALRLVLWLAAITLIVSGSGLTACGLFGRSGPGTSGSGTGTAAPVKMSPLPRSVPQRIRIAAIGVDAPIVQMGLDAQGRLETPPLNRPNLTGWYGGGPSPGEYGPAVIEGHVDSKAGPSVFYRLNKLTNGTRVEVTRQDGSTVVFQVVGMEQVRKDAFPTQKVYGALKYSALRLVTCGGTFNTATGHYEDNIIVYANRVPA